MRGKDGATVTRPDPEVTVRRLRRMRDCLERVVEIRDRGADRLRDDSAARAELERLLQVALQACIDAGADLLLACNGELPGSYSEAFDRLGVHGILPGPLCRRLHEVADLRNRLVFRYLEPDDPSALLDRLEVIDTMGAFAKAVERHLEDEGTD